MNDFSYSLIAKFIKVFLWRGRLLGKENLPERGPAVFVSNHQESLAPLACVSEIPLRLYPWIHWKMLSDEESVEFLRVDFVEKTLHLRPRLSYSVARGLSSIVLPLLRGVGCIPVHRGEDFARKRITWELSLARLKAKQCLLVFPEDPDCPPDSATGVHQFMHGVLWLADVYYRATGSPLPFYLVAVDSSRRMKVQPPIMLSPSSYKETNGKEYWLHLFEQTIIEMLLELQATTKTAPHSIL
jgi:hypothetical protein